jgi:hypothetical protein
MKKIEIGVSNKEFAAFEAFVSTNKCQHNDRKVRRDILKRGIEYVLDTAEEYLFKNYKT